MKMMRSRRILGQNRQDEQAKVMKAKHADHARDGISILLATLCNRLRPLSSRADIFTPFFNKNLRHSS